MFSALLVTGAYFTQASFCWPFQSFFMYLLLRKVNCIEYSDPFSGKHTALLYPGQYYESCKKEGKLNKRIRKKGKLKRQKRENPVGLAQHNSKAWLLCGFKLSTLSYLFHTPCSGTVTALQSTLCHQAHGVHAQGVRLLTTYYPNRTQHCTRCINYQRCSIC